VVIATLLLGALQAGYVWGSGYLHPLFVEGLAVGDGNLDELYHACVCNMIRTYGVPSTGLDGVPYCPYHYGSHLIFAQLCGLLDSTPLDFYNRDFPVVFLPFLVHAVAVAGAALVPPQAAPGRRGARFLVWLALMCTFGSVLPRSAANALAIWQSWTSESFCVALSLLLLGAAAWWPVLRRAYHGPESFGRPGAAALALAFALFLALLGFAKVSVMCLALAAAAWFVCRIAGAKRRARVFLFLLPSALIFPLVCRLVLPAAHRPGKLHEDVIKPFGIFWNDHVHPEWRPYFFVLPFLIPCAAAFSRFRQEAVSTLGDLMGALRPGRLLDVELLLVIAVVGFIPHLLVVGTASVYFADVQQWVALAVLAGALWSAGFAEPAAAPVPRSRLPLWIIPAALVLAAVVGSLLQQTTEQLHDVGLRRARVRAGAAAGTGGGERPERARAETLGALRALGQLSRADRRVTLLHIPTTNRSYWELFPPGEPRRAGPFVAPALSGLALLDGLPDPEPKLELEEYGYDTYELPKSPRPRVPVEQNKDRLCRRAEQLGFSHVIVLDADGDGRPLLREWCLDGARPILPETAGAAARRRAPLRPAAAGRGPHYSAALSLRAATLSRRPGRSSEAAAASDMPAARQTARTAPNGRNAR
jgi:hypothetical protein